MTFHSFDMRGIGARRLRFAILASLVFHLLLLWPDLPRMPNPEALLLQATLRQSSMAPLAAVPAPSPTPHTPVRPAGDLAGTQAEPASSAADSAAGGAPAPRPPVLASRETEPSKPAAVLPAPAPAKPAAPVTSPAPRPLVPDAAVAMPVPATVAPAAVSSSGTLLTQANATGEALDGLRGYRLSVAIQARRFKRYPREAMAEGWAGSTEVRLEVGSDGRPRAATVVRPSGHEALDRAALTMIDSGAQRARLPASLRGKSFAVLLPVVFNLEDE